MPTEVIMPKVDMDMAKGSVSAWLVEEGSAVGQGEPLFEIETDKATMEVESPATGTLHNIVAVTGEQIPVGTPIAWIYGDGEDVGPPPGTGIGAPSVAADVAPDTPTTVANTPEPPTVATDLPGKVRATPLARRLAREHGIDLNQVSGTGPRGRIGRLDVIGFTSGEPIAVKSSSAAATRPATLSNTGLSIFQDGPDNGPTVLLIHGMTADASSWARVLPTLARDNRVLRLELPNHGRSARYAVASFSELVEQVLASLAPLLSESVHLVGHSLGGAVAANIASLKSTKVRSLTLVAPAGLGPEIDYEALRGVARASKPESLAPWLKRFAANPEAFSWNYISAAMLARADKDMRDSQVEMIEALFPDGVQGFDIRETLKSDSMRTKIIWGRRDRIIPWRQSLAAPGEVALHLLEDVGHLPHFEAPNRINRLLAEQIDSA